MIDAALPDSFVADWRQHYNATRARIAEAEKRAGVNDPGVVREAEFERWKREDAAVKREHIRQIQIEESAESLRRCKEFWGRQTPRHGAPRYPTVEEILIAVSRAFGVPVLALKSARRVADVVNPRQIAMYLAKTMTRNSLPEIGRRIGDRDHTTILHGFRKIAALCERDPALRERISEIEREILSKLA